jgi:hypothetical protein
MTSMTPPFNPPYLSTRETTDGTAYVETLADGTIRPASVEQIARLRSGVGAGTTSLSVASPATSKAAGKPEVQGRVFLNVPFAEKDAAKGHGAKWDATQKKWYVPVGVDVNLFSRWWPDALK